MIAETSLAMIAVLAQWPVPMMHLMRLSIVYISPFVHVDLGRPGSISCQIHIYLLADSDQGVRTPSSDYES